MATSEQLSLGFAPPVASNTPLRSDLPEGWQQRPLGDLVTVAGGGTPSKGNPAYWNGSIPWVSPKDMKAFEIVGTQDYITDLALANSTTKLVPPNSVLVVFRSGILAHTLPVAINRVSVALNQDMKALTPRSLITAEYLAYYLRSAQRNILATAKKTGATVESIDADSFFRVLVPCPPLAEQRRIVARIEELAARIERARGLRGRAKAEVSVLMRKALESTREDLSCDDFPKQQLGRIARVTAGGTPSRSVPAYWNGDIPWIKTGELLDGDIDGAAEFISQEGLNDSSAKLFPPGTVLVALYGQGQTRGRTGHLMISAATNQACCAILPVPSQLNPRYVQYWLRSLYAELREQARGASQDNLNSAMIKSIEIVVPSLSEQCRIVAYLDSLQAKADALQRLQAESAIELDALLPAVLERAFKGEM